MHTFRLFSLNTIQFLHCFLINIFKVTLNPEIFVLNVFHLQELFRCSNVFYRKPKLTSTCNAFLQMKWSWCYMFLTLFQIFITDVSKCRRICRVSSSRKMRLFYYYLYILELTGWTWLRLPMYCWWSLYLTLPRNYRL